MLNVQMVQYLQQLIPIARSCHLGNVTQDDCHVSILHNLHNVHKENGAELAIK